MRILSVNIHLPDPDKGGGWTLFYEQLKTAAERHEIMLLTGALAPGERSTSLNDVGIDVRGVAWTEPPRSHGLRLLVEAFRGPGIHRFRTVHPAVQALSRAVRQAEDERRYDVVVVQPGEIAPVVTAASAPTALFLTDCYTVQVRRGWRARTPWKQRLITAAEGLHVRRWEREHYRHASALAAVSDDDAAALHRITGRQVDVIPIAVGDQWFEPADRPRERDLVSIIAALNYLPNVDGIMWFTREVWPRVRAAYPPARLRVVGRDPVAEVRAAVADAGGELHADVPDIRPYYWEASVVAVPLRLGSGVKTKMLHAFACGAPVVATPIAAEGMPIADGMEALVRADADGLADAIVAVLRDPPAAEVRANKARAIVECHRSERVAETYETFLQRAARQPRRDGAS